jgi:hypothetical protein
MEKVCKIFCQPGYFETRKIDSSLVVDILFENSILKTAMNRLNLFRYFLHFKEFKY